MRAAGTLATVEPLHAHLPRRRSVLPRRFHAGVESGVAQVEARRPGNARVGDRAPLVVAESYVDGAEIGRAVAADGDRVGARSRARAEGAVLADVVHAGAD